MRSNLLFGALFFLAACGGNDAGKESAAGADSTALEVPPNGPEVLRASEALPALYAWMAQQDSSFRAQGFAEFSPVDSDTLAAQPMPAAELDKWRPYLLYNNDSSFAIDLYSYNYVLQQRNGKPTLEEGGPDFEVGVIDLATGRRRRLYFTGPGAYVLDAAWTDSRTVLLAVAEVRGATRFRPTLHRFNAATGQSTLSTYASELAGNAATYVRKFEALPKTF